MKNLICFIGSIVLAGNLVAGDITDKLKFIPDIESGNCIPVTVHQIKEIQAKMREGKVKILAPTAKWSEYIIVEIDDTKSGTQKRISMYEDYEDCGADLYDTMITTGKIK